MAVKEIIKKKDGHKITAREARKKLRQLCPQCPGIYVTLGPQSATGYRKPLYVGASTNLRQRVPEQCLNNRNFKKYKPGLIKLIIVKTPLRAFQIEGKLIELYKPLLNGGQRHFIPSSVWNWRGA